MKRLNWIVLSLSFVTITTLTFLSAWKVGAQSVRLNVRDLSEHSLFLVAATDPSFDAQLAKLGVRTDQVLPRSVDVTRPFSVIIRNQSSRDVIAYRLRWDVIQPDGTLTTQLTTYAEPDALMGGSRSGLPDMGAAISAGSARYVSLAGLESQTATMAMGGSSLPTSDLNAIQEIAAQKNQVALLDFLRNKLAKAQSLTVTLDVAIFDDGRFVGPDSFNYFAQMRAEIDAKQDLLRDALFAAQQNKPLERVYDSAETIANEPEMFIGPDSSQADYYKFYKREFAREFLRMRVSSRDDKTAVWLATSRLYKQWPTLRKK